MPNPTISETITYGRISTYLVGNNNSNGNLFGGRLSAPGSMVSIAMITDALAWGQNSQSTQNVRSMANYLIWLIGMFGQQAQVISGGGGGGHIIPPPPTSLPQPIDWRVSGTASATAPLATGETSVVLDGTGGMPDLRGYNVDFFRNNTIQHTTDAGDGSTYYSWNRISGLFTLINGAAQSTELMRISPIG